MTSEQIQNNLAIIKTMIEKSRRETAESGHFFIAIGIFAMIMTVVISYLELSGRSGLVIPAFIFMLLASGIIGYLTVKRKQQKEGAVPYHKKIVYSIWFACTLPLLIVLFLFPFLKIYPWNLVPVLTTLIMGIAVFSSGMIFEVKAIVWSSLAWYGGSVGLALISGPVRLYIMLATILLGWVLPGWILNRRYRQRRRDDES